MQFNFLNEVFDKSQNFFFVAFFSFLSFLYILLIFYEENSKRKSRYDTSYFSQKVDLLKNSNKHRLVLINFSNTFNLF